MKVGLIGDSLTEGRPGVSFITILEGKHPSISFANLGKNQLKVYIHVYLNPN
ncbi:MULTISPECIES: hypothetical protein [Ornithinibacillus]|uniref:hypothetical protein n=1 Tax=Ornithinibacillus TaxID=484508 RepID=UPI001FE6B721|nr:MULTISPECIES: hypothetical protein [Ornithinibacillus]